MGSSFWVSIIIQGVLMIWLLASVRVHRKEYYFFDRNSTTALKGWFSIVIVSFHVPTSSILCNLLGCVLFVVIVTMFSFFSTYGMTVKVQENREYLNTIPTRFVRIAILYGVVLLLKYFVTGNMFSGGILWMNSLLLSYLVFYLSYLPDTGGGILAT